MLGHETHSPEDLRTKRIDELKGIFDAEHRQVTTPEPVGMKRMRETARNLLLMGKLTAEEISRATGLSAEEVEGIRDADEKSA